MLSLSFNSATQRFKKCTKNLGITKKALGWMMELFLSTGLRYLRSRVERDTRENGVKKRIRNTDTELRYGEMGLCIKAIGKMTKPTVGED